MKTVRILTRLTAVISLSVAAAAAAGVATLGNNPAGGGVLDSWSAILTVNESDTYTNTTGGVESVSVTQFNVNIGAVRGRVTPFLVRVNANDNFTILAIGRTRIAGTDYTSTGVKSFAFADTAPVITLSAGQKLAAGYTDANPDGTGNAGSVVPFVDGGDEIWLTGGPAASNAGKLTLDAAPAAGATTYSTLTRQYSFNLSATTTPAGPLAPSAITLAALDLFPGLPAGSDAGSLTTVDPNTGDTHTYSLTANPGGLFSISGSTLRTAGAPGPAGAAYTLRIRTTDQTSLFLEQDFTLTVAEPQPPVALQCTAGRVIAGTAPGAVLGRFSTTDANTADVHIYTPANGAGDGDNALFTIGGDELRLAAAVPAGRASLTMRVRSTDRAQLRVEAAFTLTVVEASVRINEFVATNDSGVKDEDGAAEDWIELHNPLAAAVDLTGWRLTDDPEQPAQWIFPARTLPAGGFLAVFASGKNRTPASGNLHTNFRLDGSSGEYLALIKPDGTIADAIAARPQFTDLAFGVDAAGSAIGYLTPTPNAANGSVFPYGLNEVAVSVPRGYYNSTQTVALVASIPGSLIRYTTDGTKPSATNGLTYTSPLAIAPDAAGSTRGTKRLRAIALHQGAAAARIATHSYLFVNGVTAPATDGIVSQTNSNSSAQTTAIKNNAIYGPLMDDALLGLPAIVINNPPGLPSPSETESSVELLDPSNAEPGFQIDCGIQAVGAHSLGSPKNNFRLYFRAEYNAPKLKYDVFKNHPYSAVHPPVSSFDRLSLRSGSHDSFFWMADPANPPMPGVKGDALYLRSVIMDDLHLAMGHIAPHGRFVQVIVNGAYHGLYHVREYPNDDFFASYLPGGKESFDFTNAANPGENGTPNWQATWAQLKTAAATSAAAAARWIDLAQLADYMVLNFWAGNVWDWNPNQNWMGGGPNTPDRGGWIFLSYDNDVIWNDAAANVTHPSNLYFQPQTALAPGGLFFTTPTTDVTLMDHADFRVIFRDRFYKACFHGGVLETASAQAMLDFRSNQIRTAIIAETARWQPGAATSLPWDRNGEWQTELTRIRDNFIPSRCATLMTQVKARGWYPVDAPEFQQHGGPVPAGYQPVLTGPSGADIYATLDGSDPRLPGGALSAAAILVTTPPPVALVLNGPALVRVRARRTSDNEWSALNEASFVPQNTVPAASENLVISEIHYHPDPATPPPGNTEFLEFMNVSTSFVDLSGAYFTRGLDFAFPPGSILAPGQRLVVRESQFLNGTALSNSGEDLTLVQPGGAVIRDFRYRDSLPWPESPDGGGPSLVLIAPSAAHATDAWHNDGLNWQPSFAAGGTPGTSEGAGYAAWKTANGITSDSADIDHDGLTALAEYATGADPATPSLYSLPQFTRDAAGNLIATLTRSLTAGDVDWQIESATDMQSWTPLSGLTTAARNVNGSTETLSLVLPATPGDGRRFHRVHFTLATP